MVIFKFQKTSTAALAAHVDTLRAVTYLFRRAGFAVQYSQGYNPHMELGFSPPLPLGTESLCEYVSAKMPFSFGLTEKLSPLCPPGLKFVKCAEGNVNLAAEIDGAQYLVKAAGIGNYVEEGAKNGFFLQTDKGEKDVSSLVYATQKVDANSALVTLALGNCGLRADKLVKSLLAQHGADCDYSVLKTIAYIKGVDADEILFPTK